MNIELREMAFWASIVGVILAWFRSADDGLDIPKRWSRLLFLADKTAKFGLAAGGWVHGFAKMFDRVFGSKHLSWQCYLRALVVSILTVLAVSLYVLMGRANGHTGFSQQFSPFTTIQFWVFAIVVNGTIDYISLLETRFLIGRMQQTQSLPKQLAIIVVDILATAVIFVLTLSLMALVLSPLYARALEYFAVVQQGGAKSAQTFVWSFHVVHLMQNILSVLANVRVDLAAVLHVDESNPLLRLLLPGTGFQTEGVASEMFFAATFVTSIWLWLYGSSILVVRLASLSSPVMRIVRRIFQWRTRPMLSLGLIASFLWTVCFWTWIWLRE